MSEWQVVPKAAGRLGGKRAFVVHGHGKVSLQLHRPFRNLEMFDLDAMLESSIQERVARMASSSGSRHTGVGNGDDTTNSETNLICIARSTATSPRLSKTLEIRG